MTKLLTIRLFERERSEELDFQGTPFFARATGNKAVVKDQQSQDQLIFEGDRFTYRDGVIASGFIERLTVANEDGRPHQVFSNLHVKAGSLTGETMLEVVQSIVQRIAARDTQIVGTSLDDGIKATRGDDRLLGRGGDDFLNGSLGRDVLIGGAGSDTFFFVGGSGHDTIVDFDADGGAGQQDFIDAFFPDVEAFRRDGRDTILDFGDGDTIRLLDVRPSHIDISDFV